MVTVLTAAPGCHRIVSGVDPEPLGYGPAQPALLASGYDPDPVPRPAPTPWMPPDPAERYTATVLAGWLGVPGGVPGTPEPVAYSADVISVCEHLASRNFAGSSEAVCLRHYQIAQVFRTADDWRALVTCLEASTEAGDIADCERATPASLTAVTEHPRESTVCMHVFALSVVEELGPEPALDATRLGEFEPLLAGCVDALVTEQRAKREPSNYAAMLECVEAARTTAAAVLCES